MHEQLRLLVELQKLDTELISRDRRIKEIPARISSMKKPIVTAEANLEAQKKKLQAAEKKKKDKELQLQENEDRIHKLKDRTSDIKDNKAYQAHLKEIENAQTKSYKIEDEILELMEAIEAEGRDVGVAEEALRKQHEEADRLKKELEAEVAEARKELDSLKARRSEFTRSLKKEHYETYMNVLTTHGGLAVAEARGGICTGCFMSIMPQLFVEIRKNEQVFQCPQCSRILHYKGEAEEGEKQG